MTLQAACNQIDIEYKEAPTDGKWHTTAVIGKGGKNTAGRIKLFSDGQGGTVANWTSGETLTFWNDDTPAKLTAEQKQERAARIAAAKQQEEADKADCRKRSAELWELARQEVPADHNYLIKKQVKPYGIRWQKSGNLLVIPVQDMAGSFHGLQFIVVTPSPEEENPTETATETTVEHNADPLTAAVNRLAKLPLLRYAKERKEEAKALGVNVAALDAAVKATRKEESNTADFIEVEPWAEPVDGAALLTTITATIRRFIICEPQTAQAVALWVAMTWFIDVVEVAPLAVITAPEKRCGKSMLLFLIGRLVPRPLMSSSISPSALFRSIDAWQPTLLIDEVDACLKDNEELRGLINCGHTRDSAFTIRCVGDDHTPKRFNVWGAKALSGIGHVADTLMDRSIILELRRKLSHESVDRIRHAEADLFINLCSKLARFAEDNSEKVRLARPSLPHSLNDRAQDNWEPLLAIATVAGGEWFKIGTAAALKISGGESLALSIGTELLSDIHEIFALKKVDRISTAELIKELVTDDEKPWATYNRGFPIKPRQIATKLKGYDIHSKDIRINSAILKGYDSKQFEDAFLRYATPPEIIRNTQQTAPEAALPVADITQRCGSVADNVTRKPATSADVALLRIEPPFQTDIILTESDFEGVTL